MEKSKVQIMDYRKFMTELNDKFKSISFLKEQFEFMDGACDRALMLNGSIDNKPARMANRYLLEVYDELIKEVSELNLMLAEGRSCFISDDVTL